MSVWLDWAAALGTPGGVLAGVLGTKWFDRRVNKTASQKNQSEAGKFDADAVQAITTAAVTLVAPLNKEIDDLRKELGEVKTQVESLSSENTLTNSRLSLAIEHIRALRSWISTHIPDKTPPLPPESLGL